MVLLFIATASFVVGVVLMRAFDKIVYAVGQTQNTVIDQRFCNGLSIIFAVRMFVQGVKLPSKYTSIVGLILLHADNKTDFPSRQQSVSTALHRLLTEKYRQRLYVGHKKWLIWGEEYWYAAHPAIVAHVFHLGNKHSWTKLNLEQTNRALYKYKKAWNNTREPVLGLLYLGDSKQWHVLRKNLTPFFKDSDFTVLTNRLRDIARKHLDQVMQKHEGLCELLQQTLMITADMLCQVLYDCELPPDELDTLVETLMNYTVPDETTEAEKQTRADNHKNIAMKMAEQTKEGTLAWILKQNCPSLSEEIRNENIGFFLEALTPSVASLWTIAHVALKNMQDRCWNDVTFRSQCIKEGMRMYPPVPSLWPRMATKDHEMKNPLYEPNAQIKNSMGRRGWLSNLIFGKPIEEQPTITIRKGTKVFIFPSIMHYDPRFWTSPEEFDPGRWDEHPDILTGRGGSSQLNRKSFSGRCLVGYEKQATSFKYQTLNEESRSVDPLRWARNMTRQGIEQCLRSRVFGKRHEVDTTRAYLEDIAERVTADRKRLEAWSYLPFGGGPHMCLGRRLAACMVDSLVYTFMEYGVHFIPESVPSILVSKPWHQRTTSFVATYNYPVDPIHVLLSGRRNVHEFVGDPNAHPSITCRF